MLDIGVSLESINAAGESLLYKSLSEEREPNFIFPSVFGVWPEHDKSVSVSLQEFSIKMKIRRQSESEGTSTYMIEEEFLTDNFRYRPQGNGRHRFIVELGDAVGDLRDAEILKLEVQANLSVESGELGGVSVLHRSFDAKEFSLLKRRLGEDGETEDDAEQEGGDSGLLIHDRLKAAQVGDQPQFDFGDILVRMPSDEIPETYQLVLDVPYIVPVGTYLDLNVFALSKELAKEAAASPAAKLGDLIGNPDLGWQVHHVSSSHVVVDESRRLRIMIGRLGLGEDEEKCLTNGGQLFAVPCGMPNGARTLLTWSDVSAATRKSDNKLLFAGILNTRSLVIVKPTLEFHGLARLGRTNNENTNREVLFLPEESRYSLQYLVTNPELHTCELFVPVESKAFGLWAPFGSTREIRVSLDSNLMKEKLATGHVALHRDYWILAAGSISLISDQASQGITKQYMQHSLVIDWHAKVSVTRLSYSMPSSHFRLAAQAGRGEVLLWARDLPEILIGGEDEQDEDLESNGHPFADQRNWEMVPIANNSRLFVHPRTFEPYIVAWRKVEDEEGNVVARYMSKPTHIPFGAKQVEIKVDQKVE